MTHELKDRIFTRSEYCFHHALHQAIFDDPELREKYVICPKIRVEDFIRVEGSDEKKIFGARNRIKSRHVDFLIANIS